MAASSSLRELIDEVPEGRQKACRDGFSLLAGMAPEHREQIFQLVSDTMTSGASTINLEPIGDATGLKLGQLRDAVTAISSVINFTPEGEFTPGEFLDAARGKLFDTQTEAIAAPLVERILRETQKWKASLDQRELAVRTLPAFLALELSVDLRLKFKTTRSRTLHQS